jgi:radical SAM protein with 4Fe4S-binding SPASM domain
MEQIGRLWRRAAWIKDKALSRLNYKSKSFLARARMRALSGAELDQRLDTIPARDLTVAIELTNKCNANCCFCAYRSLHREKGRMSAEFFKKSVGAVAQLGVRKLNFTPMVGDPLCHPQALELIQYAADQKCFDGMAMTTNGIAIGKFPMDLWMKCGLTQVTISTCIGNAAMYERVYGVNAYDLVMSNIKWLVRTNIACGRPLRIHVISKGEKPTETTTLSADYLELFELLGSQLSIGEDGYDNWLGEIRGSDLPKGNSFRAKPVRTGPCAELFSGFVVGYDGNVGPCWCRDLNLSLRLGSFPEQTLESIWYGEKLAALRENWRRGVVPEVCQDCFQYSSPWGNDIILDHFRTGTRDK